MRRLVMLWLALLTGGCVALPAPFAAPATTDAPAASVTPVTPGVLTQLAGVLTAHRVTAAPRLDGRTDATWASAAPTHIPLAWGLDGDPGDPAAEVELRAVYTDDDVYFLARWAGAPPAVSAAATTFNQFTIHWTIPVPEGAAGLACAVACHTAYSDGEGRIVYMNSETIPQGGLDALAAAGGWDAGEWSLAWRRPRVSANAYDLQFTDLTAAYPFFVKLFTRVAGRPDPVSAPQALVFIADR